MNPATEIIARQSVRYDRWYARVQRKPGRCRITFPEKTGEQIANILEPTDIRRWCRLVSDAIDLANDPDFRATCGCPSMEEPAK